ncbi:MAG: hypothetical protein GYB64_16210 [Chloroflexi bacterium]|nr:hypothetical protein [Chloroflexota bacterium]
MSKSFDEIMKVLEEKGEIADETAKKIMEEHGPITDDEKKQLGAAIRMKKALKPKAEGDTTASADGDDDVSMDDYLQALSTLDSDEATEEEKKAAEKIKTAFESQ